MPVHVCQEAARGAGLPGHDALLSGAANLARLSFGRDVSNDDNTPAGF